MGRDSLTPAAPDPAGGIPGYLAALDAALPAGPRRTRGAILAEIGDGLWAAVDRHRDRGAAPATAVGAALTDFGPPAVVARAFAGELATARARRLLTGLLLTGPLVGVWWLLLLAPRSWPSTPAELLRAIPVLPVVGATVVLAVAVLAATGRLAYRLPTLGPRSTLRAEQAAVIACLAVDGTLLTRAAVLAAAPAGRPAALLAAAAAASLLRLCWVAVAAVRHRRTASPGS